MANDGIEYNFDGEEKIGLSDVRDTMCTYGTKNVVPDVRRSHTHNAHIYTLCITQSMCRSTEPIVLNTKSIRFDCVSYYVFCHSLRIEADYLKENVRFSQESRVSQK